LPPSDLAIRLPGRRQCYNAGNAKLVAGFGDIEAKAIHRVIVLGWEAIGDATGT